MQAIANRWITIFLACAFLYLASEPWRPFPLHYLLKALPIAILAVCAAARLQGVLRVKTLLALGFSAGGDIMLSMTFPHQFIAGLGSFLLAQLLYGVLFFGFRNGEHAGLKAALSLGAVAYAAVMAGFILPDEAALKTAVLAYLVVITAMAVSAVWAWRGSFLHVCGAGLFVLSDSLIAWNMFASPVPYSSLLIMSTYYAAQLLLLLGILRLAQSASR